MYHVQTNPGNSPDFWEENWAAGEFQESVKFMASDPLRPLFEKYLRPESLMLEGGCGMGNYLAYYSARGYNVVGLDFAQVTLKTLHVRQPALKLAGGDVSALPYADKTFDLYYSGGVVEHFEKGTEASLAEAHRVLKDDGILLISVPYYSPLRRLMRHFRKRDWRTVERAEVDDGDLLPGKKFFQYAYQTSEFQKLLCDAGLKVIEKQGYAVLWGLSDLPFMSRDVGNGPVKGSKGKNDDIHEIDVTDLVKDGSNSILKRLVVQEDSSIPIFGLGVRFFRWSVGNMMMYVCKRK